jgi:hypothetical protein
MLNWRKTANSNDLQSRIQALYLLCGRLSLYSREGGWRGDNDDERKREGGVGSEGGKDESEDVRWSAEGIGRSWAKTREERLAKLARLAGPAGPGRIGRSEARYDGLAIVGF